MLLVTVCIISLLTSALAAPRPQGATDPSSGSGSGSGASGGGGDAGSASGSGSGDAGSGSGSGSGDGSGSGSDALGSSAQPASATPSGVENASGAPVSPGGPEPGTATEPSDLGQNATSGGGALGSEPAPSGTEGPASGSTPEMLGVTGGEPPSGAGGNSTDGPGGSTPGDVSQTPGDMGTEYPVSPGGGNDLGTPGPSGGVTDAPVVNPTPGVQEPTGTPQPPVQNVKTYVMCVSVDNKSNPISDYLTNANGKSLTVYGHWLSYKCKYGIVEPFYVNKTVYDELNQRCMEQGYHHAQPSDRDHPYSYPFQYDEFITEYYRHRTPFTFNHTPRTPVDRCADIPEDRRRLLAAKS